MEKIREIRSLNKCYIAGDNQYWILSARKKSYELWDNSKLLTKIMTIPAKKIYWVFPY